MTTTLNYDKDVRTFRISDSYYVNGKRYYYHSIHDYYPKNRFSDVDSSIQHVRVEIWNFKDGHLAKTIGKKIADAILDKKLALENTVLVVIPASTQEKTASRFKAFCATICDLLSIQNGYDAISTAPHEATKGQAGGDKTAYFTFNPRVYAGRHVLLFDDICTSGTSFTQVAAKLVGSGAKSVTGIFLARTVRGI